MPIVSAEEMQKLIGLEEVSDWLVVSQALIDRFAELTDDHQFIHVDPTAAASSIFGGTIAHGFLTLALFPAMRSRVPDPLQLHGERIVINYGANRLRFLAPVRSGARIRGRWKLLSFDHVDQNRYRRVQAFTVEIEGGRKPALIAEWIEQLVTG